MARSLSLDGMIQVQIAVDILAACKRKRERQQLKQRPVRAGSADDTYQLLTAGDLPSCRYTQKRSEETFFYEPEDEIIGQE